ncbi:uncharacterized protein LOC136079449 [Hydra vulgaris]|uniref:Uncharacterized protein LOC136079449 n=1 Tax=Hydra vulgaris TaxID=6087 RepID=A0ABM4BQ48_HYDVU
MISEFDPILQEHLRKIKSHEISDHYLDKNIQNQIIQLLGSEIRKSIILNCQNAKYCSIIMGCTIDITHQKQLTLVLRFYNCKLFAVEEHFIGFVEVYRTTGEVLAEVFLKHLTKAAKKCSLQTAFFDLSTAQTEIDQLLKYFNEFRDKGIKDAKLFAMEIAEVLEVSPQFESVNTVHPRKKKTIFSYVSADEPILNPETQYVVEVFNVLVDQVLSSLTSRFNQLKELSELFGFLYKIPEVTQNTEALKKHSKGLDVVLTEDGHSNVISIQLFDEIKAICSMVPGKLLPKALIKFILENHYEQSFPNLVIAL